MTESIDQRINSQTFHLQSYLGKVGVFRMPRTASADGIAPDSDI